MERLPTTLAYKLSSVREEAKWLIDGLWLDRGVGFIGAQPKCGKSFLALDMAVAVSSGTPCLRHYTVPRTGSVVLFAAEDDLCDVRSRLDGICRASKTSLDKLAIHVITVPVLRIDLEQQQRQLKETLKHLQPKLLILDPFVRLHRSNENDSGEIAQILAFLRELNRLFMTSIVVVHHAKKKSANERTGQALRGTSEFHAWTDSALFLKRTKDDRIIMSIEHRSAPSTEGIELILDQENKDAISLMYTEPYKPPPERLEVSSQERVEKAIQAAAQPLSLNAVTKICRMRKSAISHVLASLQQQGKVEKTPGGYLPVPGTGNGCLYTAGELVPGTTQERNYGRIS